MLNPPPLVNTLFGVFQFLHNNYSAHKVKTPMIQGNHWG